MYWASSISLLLSLETTLLPFSKFFIMSIYSFSLLRLFSRANLKSLSC